MVGDDEYRYGGMATIHDIQHIHAVAMVELNIQQQHIRRIFFYTVDCVCGIFKFAGDQKAADFA